MARTPLLDGHCWVQPVGPVEELDRVPVVCLLSDAGMTESLSAALPALGLPPLVLAGMDSDSWERDYTPWPGARLFRKGDDFTGGAGETLRQITQDMIPAVRAFCAERYGERPLTFGLLGYSLGGLFAIWAMCETDAFQRCAACSASLWYEGWMEYLEAHRPAAGSALYFSLGQGEEKTRNARMQRVGDHTRQTVDRLRETGAYPEVRLVWETGGHFDDTQARLARALRWLVQ